MRILTVLDSYPPDLNGGAYFTHRLAKALMIKGHDVLAICPSRSLKQGYSNYEGVSLYRVRSWPILMYKHFRVCWPLLIKRGILKAIADFKPDLVHLQGKFFLGGICYHACRQQGIPLMATNHFMPENFFHYTKLPMRYEPWFKQLTWKIVVEMLSHVDIVTTPTKTAANLLKTVGLHKEVYAISCGIDIEKFKPQQDARVLRARFSIPEKPVLLYTGRLDKEKNLPDVIRAFHLLRQRVDVHLVLTGHGEMRERLAQLISELNLDAEVTFTQYLSDDEYPLIYGLANCFVNASTAELQSIVALEAIASGLPLVVANAMALPELVVHGINGYIFEPHDIHALADHLISMFSQPNVLNQMGQASRKLSLTHSIEATAEQYETLYRSMVA